MGRNQTEAHKLWRGLKAKMMRSNSGNDISSLIYIYGFLHDSRTIGGEDEDEGKASIFRQYKRDQKRMRYVAWFCPR
jgi:hypothetical protein